MPLWDDVKSNLAEWYTVTSEKTTELARISTRRYDKFGISREIERQFSELGSFVYTGMKEGKEDFLSDPAAEGLISRIQELETELREKDREIDEIKAEFAGKQKSSPGAAPADGDDPQRDHSPENEAGAAATVITDPILAEGQDASAILVEPADESEDRPEHPAP
jgi:hypothetical protein